MVLDQLQYSIGRTLSDISNVFNDIDNTLFTNKIKVPRHADEMTGIEIQRLQQIPKDILGLQKEAQDAIAKGDAQALLKANVGIMQLQDERERILFTRPAALPLLLGSLNGAVSGLNSDVLPRLERIMDDADTVLKNGNALLRVKRAAPRDLSSFTDEEHHYLGDLRVQADNAWTAIVAKRNESDRLKASGATDLQTLAHIEQLELEIDNLTQQRNAANAAIDDLFYTEPGAVTRTIYDLDQSARQFTPKVASILADTDEAIKQAAGTLENAGELIGQVTPPVTSAIEGIDSMLTVKRTAARDESELNEEEKSYLAALRKREKEIDDLLKAKQDELDRLKKSGATDQQTKDRIDYLEWDISNTKRAREANYRETVKLLYTQPGVVPETIYGLNLSLRRFNMVEQPKIESIMDSVDDTADQAARVMEHVRGLFVVKMLVPVPDKDLLPGDKERLEQLQQELQRIEQNMQRQKGIFASIPVPATSLVTPIQPVPNKPTALADGGVPLKANVIGMGTAAAGFLRSDMLLDNQNAYLKQLDREKLKVGQQIGRIKLREVDKPGVIPQILDNMNGSVGHVRSILKNIDDVACKTTGLANRYSLLVKIGLAISAVGIVATLVLIPILLLRMILFGL